MDDFFTFEIIVLIFKCDNVNDKEKADMKNITARHSMIGSPERVKIKKKLKQGREICNYFWKIGVKS